MAFKRTVSTYFTNEKLLDRFDERAKFKGCTHSKQIMGLIEKDLESNEQHLSGNLIQTGTSFAPFVNYEPLSSPIGSGFAFCMNARDKSLIKKRIFTEVDSKIKDSFVQLLNNRPGPHDNKCFVLVKLSLDISYGLSNNDAGELVIEGHYSCSGIYFELTEGVWLKYGGHYDLTKIGYHKYLDFFKPGKKEKLQALILERTPSSDHAGGFFIPVNRFGLNYPQTLDEKKFEWIAVSDPLFSDKKTGVYLHLTGVDIYSNINRVKFTQLGKTEAGVSMNTNTRIKKIPK
ncbi:hypothetical protein MUA04_11125 [Enterobacteriaceae bacterium H11S18]|uniref:hypothetical protein n=1 Tax=Dryocola clanedunensis TaxID=2925396 RepID=UPI0022F0E3C6|nr:hypothetical protein [Dryocola clanedunensis]MCT4710738.1 hypothetical protein [Dryocola clanedunensis]